VDVRADGGLGQADLKIRLYARGQDYQSALRTTLGSSRDARHAGIQQAIADVSASNTTTLT
jgi:hypothetical protein